MNFGGPWAGLGLNQWAGPGWALIIGPVQESSPTTCTDCMIEEEKILVSSYILVRNSSSLLLLILYGDLQGSARWPRAEPRWWAHDGHGQSPSGERTTATGEAQVVSAWRPRVEPRWSCARDTRERYSGFGLTQAITMSESLERGNLTKLCLARNMWSRIQYDRRPSMTIYLARAPHITLLRLAQIVPNHGRGSKLPRLAWPAELIRLSRSEVGSIGHTIVLLKFWT